MIARLWYWLAQRLGFIPWDDDEIEWTCASHPKFLVKDCPHEHWVDER